MKVLANCGKLNNGRHAIIIEKGGHNEYITCSDYDQTLPVGSQWNHGSYTYSLPGFMNLISMENTDVTYDRFKEIAESALSYLADNDLLDDFLEDRDIDLDDDEREYFFPED